MLSKCIKYLVAFIMVFLVFGIALHYYISYPQEPEELVCHKGRLLAQVSPGTVYTKVKGMSCDYEKGMLIIEEQS